MPAGSVTRHSTYVRQNAGSSGLEIQHGNPGRVRSSPCADGEQDDLFAWDEFRRGMAQLAIFRVNGGQRLGRASGRRHAHQARRRAKYDGIVRAPTHAALTRQIAERDRRSAGYGDLLELVWRRVSRDVSNPLSIGRE